MRAYLLLAYSVPGDQGRLTPRQRKLVAGLVRSLQAHGPVAHMEADTRKPMMGRADWLRFAGRVRRAEREIRLGEKSLIVAEEES